MNFDFKIYNFGYILIIKCLSELLENNKLKILFYTLFFIFLFLHLYLISSQRLYPFIDIPNHLTSANIYRFYGDAENDFINYYDIPSLLKSNMSHLFFTSMSVFPDVESGNKIFLCLYVLLLPLSLLFLIKYVKGNVWFSLTAFFLLYNFNCNWGFTDYIISIPLLIFFYITMCGYFEKGRIYFVIILLILSVLIFFVHFQTALLTGLIYTVCNIYKLIIEKKNGSFSYRKAVKDILVFTVIFLPVFILMVISYSADSTGNEIPVFRFLTDYYKTEYFPDFPMRIASFFSEDGIHIFEDDKGAVFAAAASVLIIFPVVLYIILKLKRKSETVKNLKTDFIKITCLICLICFLVLPNNLPGQAMVYQRFSVFALLFLAVLGSIYFKNLKMKNFNKNIIIKSYTVIIILYTVLYFLLWCGYLKEFDRENKELTEEFFNITEPGAKLSGLIFERNFRRSPVYIHFQSYYNIWKKGVISTCLTDYRFTSIRRKVSYDLLPSYNEWVGLVRDYNNEYSNMDYLLVRNGSEIKIEGFEIVKHTNKWYLYKNKK